MVLEINPPNSNPEKSGSTPGWNIIKVVDTDKKPLLLPFVHDLHLSSHPAATIPNMGEMIKSPTDYPLPEVVEMDSLTPNETARLISFLQETKLPILFAFFLALNTAKKLEDWQFLKEQSVCIALTGMSEVGKSTYARVLHEQQGFPILDMELFDPAKPNKPTTIYQAIMNGCLALRESPSAIVIIDTNGMSSYQDCQRKINVADLVSHSASEVAISIEPYHQVDSPRIERVTRPVAHIGYVGTSRFIFASDGYVNPSTFVDLFLNHRELQNSQSAAPDQSLLELARFWKQELILQFSQLYLL